MQGHRLLPHPPATAAAPLAVPAAAPVAAFPPGVVKDILFSGSRSATGQELLICESICGSKIYLISTQLTVHNSHYADSFSRDVFLRGLTTHA